MNYEVNLSRDAQRFLRKADPPLVHKLVRCFMQLEQDPRGHNMSQPLRGRAEPRRWRYRVGDHRVIYQIDEERQMVDVLYISHRREAYE